MLLIKQGYSSIKIGRNVKSTDYERIKFMEKPYKMYGKSVKHSNSMN